MFAVWTGKVSALLLEDAVSTVWVCFTLSIIIEKHFYKDLMNVH